MTNTKRNPEIKVLERLSQSAVAWMLGVTTRAVRDHRDIPRTKGRYDAREVITWLRRISAKQKRAEAAELTALDAERLRKLQIANDKAEGKAIPLEIHREWLALVANKIRTAGDVLQRKFSLEAKAVLDDALAELERAVTEDDSKE